MEPTLELSSFRGRAVQRQRPATLIESGALSFVCSCQRSTTRWAQGCRPQSKQQVGFGKEDQDPASASATAKNASCCRCAKRRAGILDRDHQLPSSRLLVRSLCDNNTVAFSGW